MKKILCGEFEELRLDARLSMQETADFLGVTLRTVQRWQYQEGAPEWVRYPLRVCAGHLPWEGWEGWQVDNGYLFPPGYSRHGLQPGNIYAIPFLYQLVDHYKRKTQEKIDLTEVGLYIQEASDKESRPVSLTKYRRTNKKES